MTLGYVRRDGRAFLLAGDASAVEELEATKPGSIRGPTAVRRALT
jgi:hypothetical protein